MENHPTNAPPKKYKTGASGGDITHNAPLRKKPAQPDTGPNLYADHPAASAFQALYTGKQRRACEKDKEAGVCESDDGPGGVSVGEYG